MGYYLIYHACPFISPLIFAIIGIRSGQTDMTAYILPFKMVMPFDALSIWGWCLEWFIQLNVGLSYALCMIIATNYFICYCHNIVAMCIHFQLLIESIRDDIEQSQRECVGGQHRRLAWQRIRTKLANSVALHVKSIEYNHICLFFPFSVVLLIFRLFSARIFDLVADINSGIIFSLLPANSIALGLSMYRMEHVRKMDFSRNYD